jgi:hypothetical protein
MASQLTEIYLALLDFVDPLRRRIEAPESLEYLFSRYGWNATMDEAAFGRVREAAAFIAPLEHFLQTAEPLRQKLAADGAAGLAPSEIIDLVGSATTLVRALVAFRPPDLTGLADPLARPEFWESIAEQLFDDLLEEYLRIYQPVIYLVLRIWNVIRFDETIPTEPGRVPFTRISFDWSQAGNMFERPLESLQHAYSWNDPANPFEHRRALESAREVLRALRVPAAMFSPALAAAPFTPEPDRGIKDDVLALRATLLERYLVEQAAFARLGFEVFPAARSGEAVPTGLMVKPLLQGGGGTSLPLSSLLNVTFGAEVSAGDAIGFALFPGKADVVGGSPAIGASVELATSGTGPWYVLGNEGTSHIAIAGFAAKLSMEGSVDDPEIKLHLAFAGASGAPGAKVMLSLGDSDSFVKGTAGTSGLSFAFSPEVVWSSKTGLTFSGNPTVAFDVPLNVQVGPVTLMGAKIALGKPEQSATSTSGIALTVGASVRGTLGPVTVVLDQIGFVCAITPYSRADVRALPADSDAPALGSLGVDLQFAPPKGLGVSVDAAIVSGGGYIGHTGDEYSGALELAVGDFAVKAYGVLQTKLPGGEPGYSFVVALSVEFMPAIQLAFGFSLDGIGGLVGINRTVSIEAVETALWGHHLDGLLFPKDPVATAPQLVAALDSYFPPAKGRYLFGPLVKIGWGNDIVTGELALLLEVPEPLKILLLGEIQMAIPAAKPQLEVHMSFAGGVDFGKKLVFFDASIHDSRIEAYPISGDMAFRYGWGDDGVFALSLGGFHPAFQPPASFPTLKRLAISIASSVAQLEAQSYFALTANTLQFGARVELIAGSGSYNVHGWLGFDALCERHPLSFLFDLTAGVDLRHGTSVLASVHLDGHLSGPNPWHVAGEASLSLLFFDVSVHFDKTWGSIGDPLPLPDPGSLVLAALADRASYEGLLPPGVNAVVSLAGAPADAGEAVLVDPAATLRVSQRVMPLGQPITRFAGAPLGRTVQLTIDGIVAFGNPIDQPKPTTEEFAPAQFFEFSDAEKLSLPSFSRFSGGVEIGSDVVDLGQSTRSRAVITQLVYDTTIVDSPTDKRPGLAYALGAAAQLAMSRSATPPGRRFDRYAPPVGARTRIDLQADQWVVAGTADLTLRGEVATDGTKLGAQLALRRFLADNPDQQGSLQVVRAEEVA